MWKTRIVALLILIAGAGLGYFSYTTQREGANFPFRLGLDLSGGTHLVYHADVSAVLEADVSGSLAALRDVIERRVNLFGVSEPLVQLQNTAGDHRLIVELPGVTNVDAAIALIGQTPLLEFKVERPNGETKTIIEAQAKGERLNEDPYIATGLSGRFLKRAQLEFRSPTGGTGVGITSEPVVSIHFNDEGSALFAQITKENVGKTIAIYLDGAVISAPVVREEITGGSATISGSMDAKEAKELVGRLNAGALPLPIALLSTQTIGPALGEAATQAGVRAGMWGFAIVSLFLIFWYRAPGLISVIALFVYVAIMLAVFKIIPVTLTAAGIAAFILSIGMAVDANILIFERMKEELRAGKSVDLAMREGFARAWTSIRDSNISSMITAVILFWFGTSLIKGFALAFGLGVLVSMISAISITRTFLLSLGVTGGGKWARVLFGAGIR
ncbi:MAG: protein translocase subunit SecD [Patescibacteria group bacterium]